LSGLDLFHIRNIRNQIVLIVTATLLPFVSLLR
jgi:hypothetical protein